MSKERVRAIQEKIDDLSIKMSAYDLIKLSKGILDTENSLMKLRNTLAMKHKIYTSVSLANMIIDELKGREK